MCRGLPQSLFGSVPASVETAGDHLIYELKTMLERIVTNIWNQLRSRGSRTTNRGGLGIGNLIVDGRISSAVVTVPHGKRAEHIAILGKTGSGKSMLLRHFASQDISDGRGFIFFDLHGDASPQLLKLIAARERDTREDLSTKLIVFEPADREFSVGLNFIDQSAGQNSFVQIAEFAQVLKQRWHLDSFGARTEELLHNSLHLLADNRYSILELPSLLTSGPCRAACVRRSQNPEVKDRVRPPSRVPATFSASPDESWK